MKIIPARLLSFYGFLLPTPDTTGDVYHRVYLGAGMLMDIIYDKNGNCLNDFNFIGDER